MLERLAAMAGEKGIDQWGYCPLGWLEPLLPVGSRRRIPQGAKSVLVFLFGYYIGPYPQRNIARYALADDYHQIIGAILAELAGQLKQLYTGEEFIPFVDASPIPEVRAAGLSGLGEVGENGLLLNPLYGSYCFIGELVTTVELPRPGRVTAQGSLCSHCGACLNACPSGALTGAGFRLERCRSHITQKKGALTPWEQGQIHEGGLVWGCDCCVDACPVNRRAKQSNVPAFYRDIVPVVGEANLKALCRRKAYGWRGEAVLGRNLQILKKEKQ